VGEGVGEGVGDGDGEGDGDGDGEGEGDATVGSAWHTTVAAAAAGSCGMSGAACALPSAPRVRKPPLSTVSAATRTCPKRIRIACPRRSSGLPRAVGQFGGGSGPDGYLYSYPLTGYICITRTRDPAPAGPASAPPGASRKLGLAGVTLRAPDRFREVRSCSASRPDRAPLRTVAPGCQEYGKLS
jgi:hypothetical protein